jgi:large subunit ribosomal protein L21
MMYALVEIKGKQYKAEEGALLKVSKIDLESGKTVEFESVLAVRTDDKISFGGPYVKGAKVTAVLEGHGKDDKITVFKYKRRKDYRRKQGHRQEFSLLRVKSVKG